MRRTVLLLTGVLLALVALGSGSPKEYDDAAQVNGIEGTWQAISVENTGGLYRTPEWRLIFHDGKFTWTGSGLAPKGFYKIDANKKPAWLDITRGDPPAADDTVKCIYRIDGNTLKIAWPLEDERSQRFDIHADRRQSVSTFRRVPK